MSEPIKINTSSYTKEGKVEIDGHLWTVKLPGANTELMLNQAQRRITVLDKKVEAGNATEEDLDRYDGYEQTIFSVFQNIFQDGSNDNSEVKAWLEETPMAIIVKSFEDIQKAANNGQEKAAETPAA